MIKHIQSVFKAKFYEYRIRLIALIIPDDCQLIIDCDSLN